MNDDIREFLTRLDKRLDKMEKDIADLMAWKNKLTGIFIAISVGVSFLFNLIKDKIILGELNRIQKGR